MFRERLVQANAGIHRDSSISETCVPNMAAVMLAVYIKLCLFYPERKGDI